MSRPVRRLLVGFGGVGASGSHARACRADSARSRRGSLRRTGLMCRGT